MMVVLIRLIIEDVDQDAYYHDLDLKVHIFSLVNLRLQLPHNGCICRSPAID